MVYDDQAIRRIPNDDEIAAAAATAKAREDAQPDDNAVRDGGSDDQEQEPVDAGADCRDGDGPGFHCNVVEAQVTELITKIGGDSLCALKGLARAAAKMTCDTSNRNCHAIDVGAVFINDFKRAVEKIIVTPEYRDRTGFVFFDPNKVTKEELGAMAMQAYVGRSGQRF